MTLPASGSISTDQILAELRIANPGRNYPLSTLDADVLALAGKAGPPVKMPDDFWGKSAVTGPPPLSAVGNTFSTSYDTTASGKTVRAYPSVTPSGGSGSYTYEWSITATAGLPPTMTMADQQTVWLSRTANQGSTGSFDCTMQCIVRDAANLSSFVIITGIHGMATWGSQV